MTSLSLLHRSLSNDNNPYVTTLLDMVGEVATRVQSELGATVPASTVRRVWEALVENVLDDVLEGFSAAKRCTDMGRALMSMDLDALQRGLEKISLISPAGGGDGGGAGGGAGRDKVASAVIGRCKRRVDSYVKAFYLKDEADLIEWASENMREGVLQLRHVLRLAKLERGPMRNATKKHRKEVVAQLEGLWETHVASNTEV